MEEQNRLVGYFIASFCLLFGLIFSIFFHEASSWLTYLSLIPITIGFIFLSVQLSDDGSNHYSVFTFGILFLVWSYFFNDINNTLGRIFLVFLLAISLSFFIVGLLMSFSKDKRNSDDGDGNKMSKYFFRSIEVIIAVSVIIEFANSILDLLS